MSHPKEGESSSVAGVSKEEFGQLMVAIKGIHKNMESMKRGLSIEREEADDHLFKKMRLTKASSSSERETRSNMCLTRR